MASLADRNFHVPLPKELHEALRAEAERAGRPATALARDAIDLFLRERRKMALHDAIASFAAEHAGSVEDLDAALEQAGVEHLIESDAG